MAKVLNLNNMSKQKNIIESICSWNAARYEQIPSSELTFDLLSEELLETGQAITNEDLVETVDGLADMFYVAIGAIWKVGLSPSQIVKLLDSIDDELVRQEKELPLIAKSLLAFEMEPDIDLLAFIALRALEWLESIVFGPENALAIIRAVCDSNDTKEVKKTAHDVKANVDKGTDYIPPTDAIKVILDAVAKENFDA